MGKGQRHDFHLFKQSQTRVHPSVPLHADAGCQGWQKLHANTCQPAKATKKHPLTRAKDEGEAGGGETSCHGLSS